MSDCNNRGRTQAGDIPGRHSPMHDHYQGPPHSPSIPSGASSSASFIRRDDLFNCPPREEATADEAKAVLESASMALPPTTGSRGAAFTQQRRSKSMVVQPGMGDSSDTLSHEKKIAATETDVTCIEKRAKSCPAVKFEQDSLSAAVESDNEMSIATPDEDDCAPTKDVIITTESAGATRVGNDTAKSDTRSIENFETPQNAKSDGNTTAIAVTTKREASTLTTVASNIRDADNRNIQGRFSSSYENDSKDDHSNSDNDEIAPIAIVAETRFQRQNRYGRRSLPSSSTSLAAAAASLDYNDHNRPEQTSTAAAESMTSSLDSFLDQLQMDLQQHQDQLEQQQDGDDNDRARLSSLLIQNPHLMNSSNDLVNVGGRRRFSLPTPPQLNMTSTLFPQPSRSHQGSSSRPSSRRNSYESRMNSSSSSFLDQLQNLNLQDALLEQQEADRAETRASPSTENNASNLNSNGNNINSGPLLSTAVEPSVSLDQSLLEQDMQQPRRNNRRRSSFSDRFLMPASSTTFPGSAGVPASIRQYSSERNLMSPSLQLREVFTPPSFSTSSFASGQLGAGRIPSVPATPTGAAMANTNVAAAATTNHHSQTSRGDHCGSSPLYHAVASNAPLHTIQQILNNTPTSQTGQQNSGGLTPLHCGIERYDTSMEVLRLLLKSNPSMASTKSNKGDTPVDLLWKRFVNPEDYRSTEVKKKARLVKHLMESVVYDEEEEDNDGVEQEKPYPFSRKIQRRKRKALTLLRSNRELREFWNIMALTIKAACLGVISDDDDYNQHEYTKVGSTSTNNKGKWRLIRAAISLHCPALLIQFASALHPEQLIERDEDQRGRLPLHLAAVISAEASARAEERATTAAQVASRLRGVPLQQQVSSSYVRSSFEPYIDNGEGTIIHALLSMYPKAASYHDYDGRLPLNLALESHRLYSSEDGTAPLCSLWDGGIRDLFKSCPQSLSTRDTKTHMMPFMIAAMGDNSDINCVFRLLREGPIEALR